MFKQPIITVKGASLRGIERVDFDLANGTMDVLWRVTAMTARYNVAYQTFRATMQSDDPVAGIQSLKPSRTTNNVPQGQCLREQGRRVLDLAPTDLPVDGQDLIAAQFKQALAKAGEGRQFVFG